MSTALINAYVRPNLSNYIRYLAGSLTEAGFDGELLITQSNGRVILPDVAIEQAVKTMLPGPACVPAGFAYVGKAMA